MSTVATLVAKFEGDTSGLERSIQRTSGLADGLGASIRRIGEHALGLGLGMAGFQSLERGVGGLKDAIFGMNATLETSTLQFTTLMGDADRAKQHVADLFEFAKKTPFETGPVVEASRMLETFGGAALNTMANITLVGDAAAATSAPIQELAFWVGRAYTMIQGGQPFGEAAMRLQELAVLSAPARQRMEELQKAGASTSEVWKVLQGDLNRFNGAMLAQANTWQGLVSTFIDGAKMTLAQGFEPLFQLGKRALMGLNAAMGSPEFEAAVKRMTDWLGKAIPDAAVRTVEAASGIGSAFANAATIVAQVVGKVAEGFTGLTHIAQSAMTGLASFMSNIAKVIATAMLYISPFTRHSPSLVDQVLEGTRIIEDAWERMASRIGTLSADAARDGIQSIVRLKGALMSLAEATTGRELGAQVFALNRFGGAEAVDSFMAANDALSSMRTEFSQLGSELDDANAALKTQRDELDDLKQAHSDLQRVLQRETRDLSDWKGQLQEIGRTPILELQPLAAQLHTANDELGAATIALLSMKAAAADTIQSFASRTEALNDQIKGTKDSLSALNGKLGDLKDQMSGLLSGPLAEELPFKQKLQGLDDQILGIETKIAQQRARGADPKTYQNLTAQLEKVRAQHEAVRLEMERQIGPLRRQIDAQRDLAQGVGSQSFADRMAGLQQIVPQIASLNKQIADEKTNLRTTEDALSDLTDQQKAALAPIVAQERVVARLKDAQALLRQEYDQTVAPLNAVLDALVNKKPDPRSFQDLAAAAGGLRDMVDQAEPRISDLKLQEQALADQVEEHESVYRNAAKAIEPMTEAHRMLGDEIQSLERHLKDMVDLATSEQERLAQLAKSASPSLTLPSSTVKAPAIGDIPNFFDPEQQQRMDEATAQMQKSMDKIKGAFSDVNGALSPLTSNFGGLNANLATITNVANGALAAFVAFQGITFVAPLIAGITAAIAGGGGLAAVLVALGGPITIVAALVAGLAFAWVTDFGGIRATTEDLVTSLATWVDETVLPKLADISTFIDKTLRPAFESFASFVLTEVVPRVGAFMSALGQLKDLILTEVVPRIGNLLSILGEFKDFIGIYVLPIVEKLNEIGLAALTRVLSEVAGWFQKAGDAAAGNAGFTSMLDQLNKGLQGTHDLLASLGDIAHTVFENIRTWASENLLPWLKTLADTLDAVKVFVNGPGASSPPIAHNALGTPYFGGGLSIVGEQGPELVTLPRGVAITPMSQMGGAGAEKAAPQVNTTVHVGVSVGNNRELADLIAHENTEAFAEALAAGW